MNLQLKQVKVRVESGLAVSPQRGGGQIKSADAIMVTKFFLAL